MGCKDSCCIDLRRNTKIDFFHQLWLLDGEGVVDSYRVDLLLY
jgi:hypothetical protein